MTWWWIALASAWGMPFQLPSAEPVEPWRAPMELAGFEPGPVGDETAGVRATAVEGVGWRVSVRDEHGGVRVLWIPFPRTEADREALIWLLDSLVRPVGAPIRPAPRPEVRVEHVAGPVPEPTQPIESWTITIVREPPPPPLEPEPQPEPEPEPAPEPIAEAPPDDPDVRVVAGGGGALREGLGPSATARLAAERDLGERPFASISVAHGFRRTVAVLDSTREATRWEAEAGVGWTLPGPMAPRLHGTAGAARVGFLQDGEHVGWRVVPRLALAASADLAVAPGLALRPRVGASSDLLGVLVSIDGEARGVLSPFALGADLSLVVTAK
jgi:hypothetical protein